MTAWLLAALLLQPVLAHDGPLRLVAVGTGDASTEWTLDGAVVAHTGDGEAARVQVSAGRHELWASSAATGQWRALARPDDASPGAAQMVTAWSAVHEAEPSPSRSHGGWLLPAGAAVGSAALLVRPQKIRKTNAALRSLLQRWSRRRRT